MPKPIMKKEESKCFCEKSACAQQDKGGFVSEQFELNVNRKIANIHEKLTLLQDALVPVLEEEKPNVPIKADPTEFAPKVPLFGTFKLIENLLDSVTSRITAITERVHV